MIERRTIDVRQRDCKLLRHWLRLRIFDARLEAYLGASHVLTMPRCRPPAKSSKTAAHIVDDRHIIAALRAKPGALAQMAYRDALWPRPAYARAWEALSAAKPAHGSPRKGLSSPVQSC